MSDLGLCVTQSADGGDRGLLDGWYIGVFGVKCGKDAVEVCGTAEERGTNGVKDVVKMVAAPLCKIPTHGWS